MKAFGTALAAFALLVISGMAQPADAAVVTRTVRVHAAASISARVTGVLRRGTTLNAACAGGWCYIGKKGWVESRYLRFNGGVAADYGARPEPKYFQYHPGYDDNFTGFYEYGYSAGNNWGYGPWGPWGWGPWGPWGYGPWYGYGYGPWPNHWHGHNRHADNGGGPPPGGYQYRGKPQNGGGGHGTGGHIPHR